MNQKYFEKENEKENYNYYIDDTEDENFCDKKKENNLFLNPNENKEKIPLKEENNELYNRYNDILNKYINMKKEIEKIKELFIKRNKINIKGDNVNQVEIKKLIEKSIDLKKNINDNNDTFDYNKINYILWEMDNEIKEKENIINNYKIEKEKLENEVSEKFKYFDEYITNNKTNIKNLLSQLFNLLVQFKEKINLLSKNNSNITFFQNVSPQFVSEIDKTINQINEINNISNYDIELNDNIFFDTINNFISLLCKELTNIFNINYNYKKFNFTTPKIEEIKNNNNELFSKINYIKNERIEFFKDYSELKITNQFIIKENSKLKNELNILDNKLNEITLKHNCIQKTLLINNEGKKILLNYIYRFIKNISDKELTKIMYDILNIIDQINITQLNKGLVEEKLILLENNNEKMINEAKNELGIYLLNERNKLKKLIDDYNSKIIEKNNFLQKLNEEYDIKENLYSNHMNELKEKNEFLINENEELANRLIIMGRENYKHKDSNIINKENSEKKIYQNSSSKLFDKTMELLEKNKKINNL